MTVLHCLLVVALASFPGARASPDVPPPPHDLHVSYGNGAVEGRSVVVRLRFFRDDLEAALGAELGVDVLAMDTTSVVDGIFLRYLERHFSLEVKGARLRPEIVARGEDLLDREPVWWYALHFEAAVPIGTFRVRNTLLFDRFDDQRNVVKFVHFPGEEQRTYAFARGEEVFTVAFGGG